MKSRLFTLVLLALSLALALPGAVVAEDAPPPHPAYGAADFPTPPPVAQQAIPSEDEWSQGKPFAMARAQASAAGIDAADVKLGQPGLSFRYVKTFGESETAYLEDSNHFYDVEGIGTDGNNLWVVDSWGDRVVKYDNSGAFLQKIGKAGFRDSTGASLDYITDIAVDAGGNIWVADGGAVHVVKYDTTGKRVSELGQAWSAGSDNAHFNDPISIALDGAGNIYVSDSGLWDDYGNHRVQVFDSSGSYLATIGQTGVPGSDNIHLHQPRHIAVYGNRLYVADAGNHRVQIFDISNPASPLHAATLGTTGVSGSDNSHFDGPEGVGVDANYIYVADSNNQRVQIFSRTTRAYVATIGAGTYGTDNSHFNHPSDVAIDASGFIYVADNWNKRVQQYSPNRVYQRTYGTAGMSYVTDAHHYYFPSGVAVAKDGSTYIVEERGHRLVKLDANGVAQWTVGQPGQEGDDAEHLCWPQDAAVDMQERVYVAQGGCDVRVRIFNADGTLYAYLGAGWGAGNDQFNSPQGLTIDQGNNTFIADSGNHRVQIFGPNRAYVGTLGQTGVAGSDNSHFNNPLDVAVDGNGTIYVADEGNDRVQVFDGNRQYVRTIGGGGTGSDFGHFNGYGPQRLAVDAQNRLYVADSGNNRIQVFDATGGYLTTIAGSWGSRTGQLRGPWGLASGPDGALYVADRDNDRVQKFALGVPGWKQVSINGFGDRNNQIISTLEPLAGQVFAGTMNYNGPNGAQLWRLDGAGAWTALMTNGFGDATNVAVDDLEQFKGQLYAGTWNEERTTGNTHGGQVWRSTDGQNWSRVVDAGFGDATNGEVYRLTAFGDALYAMTWSYTPNHGTEIWRSSTGNQADWARVVTNGFGDANNLAILSAEAFQGQLYVGTDNVVQTTNPATTTGGEVWRTADGANWTQVNQDGFGDNRNYAITSLRGFGEYLYVGTMTFKVGSGGEIWRCRTCDGSDWQRVVENGFGNPDNRVYHTLAAVEPYLYSVIGNSISGLEVWRTSDGAHWNSVEQSGFGDSNNWGPFWGDSVAALNGRLYVGTVNYAQGGEVWTRSLTADFTATPTRGAPPLTVLFTNTSAGDYSSTQWDFGDGATSTETNPAHTYAQAGTYTVKLTVGDGTDSNTVTHPAAVRVGYSLYLPVLTRNYDPLMYDNFDDPTWDGAWNPAKWMADNTATSFRQQGSVLVVTEPASANPAGGTLRAVSPQFRPWKRTQRVEARLMASSNRIGGWSPIGIALVDEEVNGHVWYAACRLGASGGSSQASFGCSIFIQQGNDYPSEYETSGFPVDYNTWCTVRIDTDPVTGNVKFYLNNMLIGSHVPADATALVGSDQMAVMITNWGVQPSSAATRYVDDVRITPAK